MKWYLQVWGSHRSVSGFQRQRLLHEWGLQYASSVLLRVDLFQSKQEKKSCRQQLQYFLNQLIQLGKPELYFGPRRLKKQCFFVTALTAGHLENHSPLCTETGTCLGMSLALLTEQFIPPVCAHHAL